MLRRIHWLVLLLAAGASASGCCCCCCNGPFQRMMRGPQVADDYRGGGSYYCGCGCGETYYGDWKSQPPRCEPCDHCGNWVGPGVPPPCEQWLPPRTGSNVPTGTAPMGPSDGPIMDGQISGPMTMAPPQHHCASCGN